MRFGQALIALVALSLLSWSVNGQDCSALGRLNDGAPSGLITDLPGSCLDETPEFAKPSGLMKYYARHPDYTSGRPDEKICWADTEIVLPAERFCESVEYFAGDFKGFERHVEDGNRAVYITCTLADARSELPGTCSFAEISGLATCTYAWATIDSFEALQSTIPGRQIRKGCVGDEGIGSYGRVNGEVYSSINYKPDNGGVLRTAVAAVSGAVVVTGAAAGGFVYNQKRRASKSSVSQKDAPTSLESSSPAAPADEETAVNRPATTSAAGRRVSGGSKRKSSGVSGGSKRRASGGSKRRAGSGASSGSRKSTGSKKSSGAQI